MNPSLEDELLHCTSSSQKAGSTMLGAKLPRNRDGETKLQLFLLTWQVEKTLMAGVSWKGSSHPEHKLFSAQLSLLFTPPTSPC